MVLRSGWLGICFLGLGCVALPTIDPDPTVAAARHLWDEGQEAMKRGQTDQAIALYEQSLAEDPKLTCNHLSLAAAYLEKDDLGHACPHLADYVEANPDRLTFRLHYAEVLTRLKRFADARLQFECTICAMQEQGTWANHNLIRCHGRLVALAMQSEDEYDEHLHRGIGLYLLARQRSAMSDPEGELPAEGLLCKAAAELTAATQQRPNEARPSWYLYEVWSHLGQQHPAACRLREAESAGPFTYLTPVEQRDLQLALLSYNGALIQK